MAGPWEKYSGQAQAPSQAAPAGPWAKYAQQPTGRPQAPAAGNPEVFKSGPATQAAPEKPEYPMGLLKQFGTGAAKGVVGVAALPADAREGTASISKWASEKLGASPETAAMIAEAVRGGFLTFPGGMGATSGQLIDKANEVTRPAPTLSNLVTGEQPKGILERQPQSVGEEYAGTVGEFIPGVLGPGGAVRKAAQVLVPALASETAGQVTKGTEYEPYARVAGGLAGGLAVAGKNVTSTTKQIAKGAPTRAAVQAQTDAMYTKLRDAGITYDANAFQNMATGLLSKLTQSGFRKAQAPMTADALEAVAEQVGKSPDFNDFESIRKITGNILREPNATATDKKAAELLLDALDDFASKSPLATNGSVAPNKVAPLMKEAREMARRNIIAKQVEDMFSKAETYQSGYEAGLRNQFSNYLRSNKARGLSPQERKAFMEAAKGNWTNNLLGSFGKLGVDFGNLGNRATLLPGSAAGLGVMAGEPVTGALTVAAATAAKYAARKGTQNAAERASKVVLAGRGAQKAGAAALRSQQIQTMLRRLIATDSARRSDQVAPYTANQNEGKDR
jgi:hypothetical protein